MIVLFGIIYFAFSSRSIYHFWIDRSNPPGSITSHKRFTSLKALRLSSGLTSLTICFKPEIVVYKFLVGWAPDGIMSAWYFCLSKTSHPAFKVFVDASLRKPRGSTCGRATGKNIADKVFKKYGPGEKLPTSQVAWRDSTHKYPASVAAPALPGMRMKNYLRG